MIWFFFCISQICFFTGGWIFFVKQLFRDYEVRHVSVQLIFSSTFALSLTMFELIIFEIIGLLESSSRYFHWRLELTLLLFMVIALIPFYIAYSSISNISFGKIISLNTHAMSKKKMMTSNHGVDLIQWNEWNWINSVESYFEFSRSFPVIIF